MGMPSITLTVALVSLLSAAACGLDLQFDRRPIRFAKTGLGMSLGVAFVALAATVI